MSGLTEKEYKAALAELADYERHIVESDRLAQFNSMKIAATLDRLYHDYRWIEERNAQRAATAKTSRGGAPVDPASRSQFSTWVRDRFHRYQPRRVYQLLDAQSIATNYLHHGAVNPTEERQVRPLRVLTSVANGSGVRIPEVWDLACKLAAEDGLDRPTEEYVRRGIAEWNRLNLPHAYVAPGERKSAAQRAADRAWKLERRAEAAWRELFAAGADEQINAFLDAVRSDVEKWQAEHDV